MTTQPGHRIAEEQAALRRAAAWSGRGGARGGFRRGGCGGRAPAARSPRVDGPVRARRHHPCGRRVDQHRWRRAHLLGSRVSIGGRNLITLLFQAWQAGPDRR